MENTEWIVFFSRILLGLLLIVQGFDKIFVLGISKVVESFRFEFRRFNFPGPLLLLAALGSSIIEFAGGLFLIAGLGRDFVLPIIGFDLLLVSFAFTLIKPVWDMREVFPRFFLLVLLFIISPVFDPWSLDRLLGLF
jgi:uncharacterized membrane protein YphA (DoxX/SURF4 family)